MENSRGTTSQGEVLQNSVKRTFLYARGDVKRSDYKPIGN